MTDLPFGRGSSPLQNLILLNKSKTKISAIKCNQIIDGGPIYLKKTLNLNGSAEIILSRMKKIIDKMILNIILKNPKPKKQVGRVKKFKRLKNSEINFKKTKKIIDFYNKIRMFDSKSYNKTYIRINNFFIKLYNAKKYKNKIYAKTIISFKK